MVGWLFAGGIAPLVRHLRFDSSSRKIEKKRRRGQQLMPVFTWTESFSVKVRVFDQQHKGLIAIINKLYDGISAGKGNEVMGETLKSMLDYTRTHFAAEEDLMRAMNYSAYESHKKEHDSFLARVVAMQQRYIKGEIGLSADAMKFLKDWLIEHILGVDKSYSAFFTERGVK